MIYCNGSFTQIVSPDLKVKFQPDAVSLNDCSDADADVDNTINCQLMSGGVTTVPSPTNGSASCTVGSVDVVDNRSASASFDSTVVVCQNNAITNASRNCAFDGSRTGTASANVHAVQMLLYMEVQMILYMAMQMHLCISILIHQRMPVNATSAMCVDDGANRLHIPTQLHLAEGDLLRTKLLSSRTSTKAF